ncbi:RCC1/BLIP-II [Ascodesmis nigricans]|uniref:RCC1/BLIP-II n=1 Tax=Ascodesmis nigricans TaxID=341454 RepID=A0A4S2N708_9PEZI|nr:RCC1/BLIP-II [Ascodesmis nigricans]
MLLAIGSNGRGQLSLGHDEDTYIPSPCVVPDNFPTTAPKAIVAGGNHTLVLFPDGRLFAVGSNEFGQCGIAGDDSSKLFMSFQEVKLPDDDGGSGWNHVAAGWEVSTLVSASGKVYSCGRGTRGELGLGPERHVSHQLAQIKGLPELQVVSVSSGMAHNVIVYQTGEVIGWGVGRKGQLGSPSTKMVWIPQPVKVGIKAAKVICGREFSFLITADGEKHEVLGGEKYGISVSSPPQGSLLGWKDLGASWGGINVLLSDGTIMAWGRNDKGQLPPTDLRGVERMAIGSEHGVALTRLHDDEASRAVAWGWGEHGNCGRNEEEGGDVIGEVFVVDIRRAGRLEMVGAGCATSWFWVQE